MEIPPEVAAKISQRQQYAWEIGLIQDFTWLRTTTSLDQREKGCRKSVQFFQLGRRSVPRLLRRVCIVKWRI